ncbi:hypothetical protein P3X46_025451 [Hevea brasiliensis]|uniref:Protein FAR1-RELATED SEQUENCE n=1 Tax=Hevea brasiliensis TaxID=3981 RepID=A0ABQ9L7D5_HEVBR|nr:hypothetical protein P3X46_025451 [Hevea brasiliensis]
MTTTPSENMWMRRQQCRCGDWKCYITYEGDSEETSMASHPQLGIYKRDFVCYHSRFAPARKKPTGEHHRDRKSVRCGCDAKMYLSKEVVEGLLEDDQVRLLPAYRKIHEADQERILLLSKARSPVHRIVKVLELEKGIQGGQLPFLERDVRNFVQNRKKIGQDNDAVLTGKRENDTMELLEACKATKEVDEDFIYDCTVNENDKIENIARSFGDSVRAYGDVVYFDTSYRSITYGMLLGAWLGIDNNGKTIYFGCVLLQEETPSSFCVGAFIRLMKGKCPQTILTDLHMGLKDAISSESPSSKQVISMWNILHKLYSWFSLSLGTQYAEFKSKFDELYHIESTEHIEFQWSQLARQEMQYLLMTTCIHIEEHSCTILTPFAFSALQHELVSVMQYASSEMTGGSYLIHHFKKMDGEHFVIWIPEDGQIHCSCKEFESSGILCRYALRERSDFVHGELPKELTRLLGEVRAMPDGDGVAMDLAPSPAG